MAILTTGPVNRDFIGGDIANWHLEAFNNSDFTVQVTLRVFDLATTPPTQIGSVTTSLSPKEHEFLTVATTSREHTIVQVEHPLGRNDVLVTVYGRDNAGRNLAGATYRHVELVETGVGVD